MVRTQPSIQAFAKISKPLGDGAATSNKRKHVIDALPESAVNHKKQRIQLLTPPETPTKSLKRAIANLSISAIPLPPLKTAGKRKRASTPDIEIPSTSPNPHNATDVPVEIEDLMNLNQAFLTALSLHYAHHGSSSPVDVRMLTPSVTLAWGKRKATIDHLRLCLGVTFFKNTKKRNTFYLSNYGNGRICIELGGKQRKVLGFNETELRAQFEQNLERAWKKWSDKDDTEAFITNLPLAEIAKCSSLVKLEPTLAKGQQRLEHVLGSKDSRHKRRKVAPAEEATRIKKEEDSEAMEISPPTIPSKPIAATRGQDLLARIQQKQHALSLLPAGPTQAQQDHTRALQRVEEILTILDLLAAGKGTGSRVSFPLPPLIQSIQASLRSPMDKSEVEKVLDVMCEEVAVGFVKFVGYAGVRAVVVNRILRPRPEVLKKRIAASAAS
jgi:hypothetical protein